jgi:hypothetical protein
LAIGIDGAPDCVVFGRSYNTDRLANGQAVYIAVRPEDVTIFPAATSEPPAGMIGGVARAALFVGECVEYQVEIEGQGSIVVNGERRAPIEEGCRVWLKLRPDGHTAWSSDWSAAIAPV